MNGPDKGDWLAACVGESPECWSSTNLVQRAAGANMYDIGFINNVPFASEPVPAAPAQKFSFDF